MPCGEAAESPPKSGGTSVRKGSTAALLACLSLASVTEAESLYVSDQVLVGVHDAKDRESAILELLPSGTRLDVITREGDFVRVKTPGGTAGWVDGKYLAPDKPARASLNELETKHQKAQQALALARKELKALQANSGNEPDARAREELAALRSENTELRETIASAETQLTELAKAQAAREAAAKGAEPSPATAWSVVQLALQPVTWGVLGFVFVVGFGLGTYLMDYRQRKRHGGFRV